MNALGYLRVMFTVEDIDETLARLRTGGAELVGRAPRPPGGPFRPGR